MNVSDLLVNDHPTSNNPHMPTMLPPQDHIYSTHRASSSLQTAMAGPYVSGIMQPPYQPPALPVAMQPIQPRAMPKTVNFQLLLSDAPQHRARLPLRVHIQPHDTTDSIITTVKNFYGLYDYGVSFQDHNGVTLIAQYENLEHNTTVHVRVTAESVADAIARRTALSPRKAPRLGQPFQMLPPPQNGHPHSRPSSRASKKRSLSPSMRRSMSARAQGKSKNRNGTRSGSQDDTDGESDTGSVSVTSSRRDQLASADISLDNIVEGGRRKRAKFESSELPLFAPPQQPSASISSMSPQRRPATNMHSPVNAQYNFGYGQPLPSPQSFGHNDYMSSGHSNHGHQQHPAMHPRARTYSVHGPSRLSGGSVTGLLPTPDPTIGSVISDEDVALQLMRLGDATNFSQGRTSTSTIDDSLSGKADVSTDGETDVEEPEKPVAKRQKTQPAAKKLRAIDTMHQYQDNTEGEDEYDDYNDGSFKGESDELGPGAFATNGVRARSKSKSVKPRSNSVSIKTQARPIVPGLVKSKSKSSSTSKIPPSPYAVPVPVRKGSSASTINTLQLNIDEDDLSSKPRCQRCRKSKKGCDRQRPCQRCKDAGIGIEGCVSEDEGNGRKGRYGRHMGVIVKKGSMDAMSSIENSMEGSLTAYSPEAVTADPSKKRKR